MNKKLITSIIVVAVIFSGIVLIWRKNLSSNEIIHTELISKYPALKGNVYLKSKPELVELETEILVCNEQSVIPYLNKSLKDPQSGKGDWQNVFVIDCDSKYYIGDINSNNGSRLFGPFDSVVDKGPAELTEPEVITALIKNWKAIAPAILPNYPPASRAFYGYPQAIQFIGNNKIFVSYQDDFNPFLAVLSYTDTGKFSYIVQQVISSGVQSKWQNWVSRYGNASSTLNFYQFSSTRLGDTVFPSDWVKVSSGVNGFK